MAFPHKPLSAASIFLLTLLSGCESGPGSPEDPVATGSLVAHQSTTPMGDPDINERILVYLRNGQPPQIAYRGELIYDYSTRYMSPEDTDVDTKIRLLSIPTGQSYEQGGEFDSDDYAAVLLDGSIALHDDSYVIDLQGSCHIDLQFIILYRRDNGSERGYELIKAAPFRNRPTRITIHGSLPGP